MDYTNTLVTGITSGMIIGIVAFCLTFVLDGFRLIVSGAVGENND